MISEVQGTLQIFPTRIRPEDCGRISSIMSRLRVSETANVAVL